MGYAAPVRRDTSPAVTPSGDDTGVMPWPVTAAALTAMLGLYFTAGPLPLLGVFALLGLASYFFRSRLVAGTMLRWAVRVAFIILILLLNQEEPTTGDYSLGSARVRNIFGQLYAAEWVVQCWRLRPGDPARSPLQALLASGFLILTASNTFDENYARYVVPVYMTFAGLGLYRYRRRLAFGRGGALARAAVLLMALGMGAALHRTFLANRGNLTEWGNRFLSDRLPYEGTGMASQPVLGATFGLRGSAVRVLKIQNFAGDAHLRGMAFDTYDSGRWSPTLVERAFRPARETDLRPTALVRRAGVVTETQVTRLTRDNALVFAPLQTAAVDKGEAEVADWAPDSGGPLRVRKRPPYDYAVTVSEREAFQGLLARPITPAYRKRCLQIPENFDARLRQLAAGITAGRSGEAGKIEAVVAYLITNHRYSLSVNPGTSDPLVGFLLSEPKKGAHCEYFASAAAMLLRCVGVPTRYVTGYFAHEGDGRQTVVRQKDAHAWCEAWVEGVGWVTVEATPGDGRPDGDKTTPVEPWRRALEWLQDRTEALADLIANLTPAQVNIGIGVLVAGALGYGAWSYYQRRRRALSVPPLPAFAYTGPPPTVGELLARFEAAYARRGVPFPPERTYGEHLGRLGGLEDAPGTPSAESRAALAEQGRRFSTLYESARFGNRADAETIEAMRRILEEIENSPA